MSRVNGVNSKDEGPKAREGQGKRTTMNNLKMMLLEI